MYKDFKVNISLFDIPRKIGVSGILRVKNDAEFLSVCIDSCINCLDELIIVYNDCTDNSPSIIEKKRCEYPSKIKVFEYKPFLYNSNLTKDEYEMVKELPNDSVHLLSNYYNYALSKCEFQYIMKIDADQVYFTSKLQMICDAYRENRKSKLKLKETILFSWVLGYLFLGTKLGIEIPLKKSSYIFETYFSVLLKLIRRNKVHISLSGVNVFLYQANSFVSLGKYLDHGMNILPPYNGMGDHSVFRLSSQTYFAPFDSKHYNRLNGRKYSIIEKLSGVHNLFPVGICWIHLNANRKSYVQQSMSNFIQNQDSYLPIETFARTSFTKINNKVENIFFSKKNKIIFSFLHTSFSNSILEWAKSFYINNDDQLSIGK